MTGYLFDPPPIPALPIAGLDVLYPVARIFCVGRNYEDHAKEMGHVVDREKPFYFSKSATALRQSGAVIAYPPGTANYHFECELVLALAAPAFKIPVAEADAAIYGYACGLDMTRRDLQLSERAKQRPWTLGKDVEASAPVSAIAPASRIGHPRRAAIGLRQNGLVRQESDISELVWSPAEIIAHLSQFYHLGPGDLIFTGTPAGVGPVAPGDRLEASIAGIGELSVLIGPTQ
ncbi:MAG TPA: fumarylacetoacetate hydrolase family protein [Roseiarcus sp.]|nr:fumarylacetoacetate hydrolase family protein [Roseiarcus sp.]